MGDIYYSISGYKNCLSCSFFKTSDSSELSEAEGVWHSNYCSITGLTLDDYLNDDEIYPICDDYRERK